MASSVPTDPLAVGQLELVGDQLIRVEVDGEAIFRPFDPAASLFVFEQVGAPGLAYGQIGLQVNGALRAISFV